jgi:hypothetical protein
MFFNLLPRGSRPLIKGIYPLGRLVYPFHARNVGLVGRPSLVTPYARESRRYRDFPRSRLNYG